MTCAEVFSHKKAQKAQKNGISLLAFQPFSSVLFVPFRG